MEETVRTRPVKGEAWQRLPKLLDKLEKLPLNQALSQVLRAAQDVGDEDLAKWCRLELQGYWSSNAAMTDDVVVPGYRTVVGQHYDIYGQLFIPPHDLPFVSETRIRCGIDEIENLIKTRSVVTIHQPGICEIIRDCLGVEVYAFKFSSANLIGIMSSIRVELLERARMIEAGPAFDTSRSGAVVAMPPGPRDSDEILELRPNIYGIASISKRFGARCGVGHSRCCRTGPIRSGNFRNYSTGQ